MIQEIKKDFRELNFTILTSVGLGITLGIIGDIIATLIAESREYLYALLWIALVIAVILIFLIFWLSLPRVKTKDIIESVTFYDKSRKIFFDYFYTYYEFAASIHHLSRLINENRSEKVIFENDDILVSSLAQYAVLRLLFARLFLHYTDAKSLDVGQIFDNKYLQAISKCPNYEIKIPNEFEIKKADNSLIIEGDNLRLKVSTVLNLKQTVSSIIHRPVPKVMDIPIRTLYEQEILSKSGSHDLLFYAFTIPIEIEFVNSKLHSLSSEIRRNNKFSDKMDLINTLISHLENQLSSRVLIERIYQRIEEDRLEIFFDMERHRDKSIKRLAESTDVNYDSDNENNKQ